MATRKLRVELEIEVRELTPEEIDTTGFDDLGEDDDADASHFDDTSAYELADIVTGMFYPDAIQEAFAGSNIFVTFEEAPTIIRAELLAA